MNPTNWNAIAATYASIQDSRRDIVFPFLAARLERTSPRTLLDYGGGDGSFALACQRAVPQIVVYEPTPRMSALATRNCRGIRNIRVVSKLKDIPLRCFDVVTMNAVWMTLPTEEACLRELARMNHLLRDTGLLIVSVTHPCFRDVRFSTYSTDLSRQEYLKDGEKFTATIFDTRKKLCLHDTHWTLGAMSRQLRTSGFLILEIAELADRQCSPMKARGSPWLVMFCAKNVFAKGQAALRLK